jgi:hypothetical protein
MTTAQIIARACTIAKAPGYAVQAGQYLNMTLQSLCQFYDFDFIKKTQTITLTSASAYDLNSDNYRTKEVFYSVGGIIFYLFQIPIETYNSLPQPDGVSNYPDRYAVDVSTIPHQILFYPPPQITQAVSVKYFPLMDDITTPESDTSVPWFPNQEYLIHRIAACVMLETDDERQPMFEAQADKMLSKFLVMDDDKEGYSQTIKLSRERFRNGNNSVPNKAFPFGG